MRLCNLKEINTFDCCHSWFQLSASNARKALLTVFMFCVTLVWAGSAQAEIGVTAQSVLIGQSISLTGPTGVIGTDFNEGFKAYIDDVNRRGGVFGRQLKLITMDDGYVAQRTLSNTEAMIRKDGVFAFSGTLGTANVISILPLLTENRIPLFAPFTGSISLRQNPNKYLFTVMASYGDEAEKMIQHLTTVGIKSIAIAYQNTVFGKEGLAGVEAAMKKRNLSPTVSASVEVDAKDAAVAAKKIASANPQAVILMMAGKTTIEFIRELKKTGVVAQVLLTSVADTNLLIKTFDKGAAGMIVAQTAPAPFSDKLAISREFRQVMKAAGQEAHIGYGGISGYISAKALVQGLQLAGTALTREKFISALEGVKSMDLGGYVLRFGPDRHNGSTYVEMTMIKPGGALFVY